MAEVSEAAKRRVVELASAIHGEGLWTMRDASDPGSIVNIFACYVQQVSDAAKRACDGSDVFGDGWRDIIGPLILPGDPDPLRDAWLALWPSSKDNLELLREELAVRGLKIVGENGND